MMLSQYPLRALAVGTLLTGLLTSALAAPAPWFKWRSKLDGQLACAQVSLGSGWEKASAPYKDSRCEKLAHAK